MKHLLFFDHTCPLCQQAVQKIQQRDAMHLFVFYPLESEIAKEKLPLSLQGEDTLVLLEEGKRVWTRSKAVFRILHLLGGKDKWMGVFCYVPGLDWVYRLVAKHRHSL